MPVFDSELVGVTAAAGAGFAPEPEKSKSVEGRRDAAGVFPELAAVCADSFRITGLERSSD